MRARRTTPRGRAGRRTTARRAARRSPALLGTACLALRLAACAPAEDARQRGAGEGSVGGVAGETVEAPEAEAAPPAVLESGTDPAGDGNGWRRGAAPDTTTRVGRVLLANRRGAPVVVLAGAGAEEVALDTIAAGDSTVVEVRVRADSVMLRAVEPDGAAEIARRPVRLLPDTAVRWEIR